MGGPRRSFPPSRLSSLPLPLRLFSLARVRSMGNPLACTRIGSHGYVAQSQNNRRPLNFKSTNSRRARCQVLFRRNERERETEKNVRSASAGAKRRRSRSLP